MLQLKNKKGDVLYEADVDTWQGHVFPEDLNLDGLYVEDNINFDLATFEGDLQIKDATLNGVLSFYKTTFNSSVWLNNIESADLIDVDKSNIIKSLHVVGSTCAGNISMSDTMVGGSVHIIDSTLTEGITIEGSTIEKSFHALGCNVHAALALNNVKTETIHIENTTSHGFTNFSNMTVNNMTTSNVDMIGTLVMRNLRVYDMTFDRTTLNSRSQVTGTWLMNVNGDSPLVIEPHKDGPLVISGEAFKIV